MAAQVETTFTFRNMDSTDALKAHALDKLSKFEKFLSRPGTAHIIFKVDGGARHLAEISLHANGQQYIGSAECPDMYQSLDEAAHKIEKQLSKSRERIKGHKGE